MGVDDDGGFGEKLLEKLFLLEFCVVIFINFNLVVWSIFVEIF